MNKDITALVLAGIITTGMLAVGAAVMTGLMTMLQAVV